LGAALAAAGASVLPLELKIARAPGGAVELAWLLRGGATYALEESADLRRWTPVCRGIRGEGEARRRRETQGGAEFFRAAATPDPEGRVQVRQLVDDFSWPLAADPSGQERRDYRRLNRLDAERGAGGEGDWSAEIAGGRLRLRAAKGGFAFVFNSLVGTASSASTLSFAAPLPAPIRTEWQMPIRAMAVRAKGKGKLKLELKARDNRVLWERTLPVDADAMISFELSLPEPESLSQVKFLNCVGLGPCDLQIDAVELIHSAPGWLAEDPLRYAFAASYGALLGMEDPVSGMTRDKARQEPGAFDSLPAAGFQALSAAMAADLGVISGEDARRIASKSVAALSAAPRRGGLPPHWLARGRPVNYSTVDAALALVAALEASAILDLHEQEAQVLEIIDGIDWKPLTTPALKASHGYGADGSVLPYVWTDWGGESAMAQLLRLLQSPDAPLFVMDSRPPVFGRRGFIVELGALFAPQLGWDRAPDRHGVVWREERERMLAANRAYFPKRRPGSAAARCGLYGLSVAEIIDENGTTAYLEAGLGDHRVPAKDGGGWIAPHYAMMSAALDPEGAAAFLLRLRELGMLGPLAGLPESVKAGNPGPVPERWHSARVSLNAFFNTAGLYHAIRARGGGRDAVYAIARVHPRLRAALARMFPEK